MSLQCKRKHKTLSLVDKNKILERLEKGERLVSLAKEYGIGRATIHDIRRNSDKIKNFLKKNENVKSARKTLKTGEFPQVEDRLYFWFLQERNTHTPISGDILREKAKFFYKEIMNKDDFQASEGWLDKFKRRFGIRLSTMGEKMSCDVDAVEPYEEKFQKVMVLTPGCGCPMDPDNKVKCPMDPDNKIKWPHSQVRKLIGLIKERQCLWNVKIPEYKDKDEREKALSDIGAEFNMCSDEIRNKIHGLRSQYTSERGKMRKSELKALNSGTKCSYQTKWEFFHTLQFMFNPTEQDFKKIIDVKKDLIASATTTTPTVPIISSSNPIERRVVEEFNKSNERLQQSIPSTSKPNVLATVRKSNANESLKRKIDLVGEDDASERLRKTTEPRDEYHIYGELVGCKIRKLPTAHAKNTVQHLINNILYEASLGKYNEVRRSHPLIECDSQLQNDDYGLSPLSCYSDPLNDDVVKEELIDDSSIEEILL